MRTKILHTSFVAIFLLSIFGCSTKKNTWLSRNYQSLNVRYNIYFNGNESYNEGLSKINQAHVDDYSEILLMYPISYHVNATVATSDMDRAGEKAKKAIKKRSIKKKPKKNFKKLKDPEYQAFLNQEEYNSMIDDSWILLGKSEFHKADFLPAVGTFTYITHHFSSNKEIVAEALLWLARSYAEMGWYYEAEDVLNNKLNRDDFTKQQTVFFAAINADLMLKEKRYNEAIPFLQLAADGEKDKRQKERFEYILGQLYQQKGDKEQAFLRYKSVTKSNPPFEMAFNARIKQTECYGGSDKNEMFKMLRKMAKDSKNSDYLDQIYCAIANVYMQAKDTAKAIQNYKLSIEKSTRNGYEKAQSLILLADLYYEQEKYLEAEPNYSEAVLLMNPQSSDFVRVNNLAQNLSELNKNYQIVSLQDSLQMMSRLPEKEKSEKIKKIIAQVIADEQAAKKKEEEEKRLAESSYGSQINNMNNTTTNMVMALGDNRNSSFYFYNNQLLAAGKTDFQKRWGTRKLEDNWRRQVKTQISNSDLAQDDTEESEESENKDGKAEDKKLDDNKSPEFYLKQLYTTPEQFENSNKEIALALYNIGFIYNDKILNKPKTIETFEELERRFPTNEKLPDVYFYMYQTYNRQGDNLKANLYRMKLISQFPNNRYAQILSQPDYEAKLRKMNIEQDSLYEQTYYAYLASNYQKVNTSYSYMAKNYPASYLMPKFMLLNSLTKAKTETQENFKKSLEELIEKYPESDVVSMAKDLLALMAQGKESKTGNSHGSLITLREKETQTVAGSDGNVLQFKNDPLEKHIYIIYVPEGRIDINKLQYNIAGYNFTKFLIKDFDIELRKGEDENMILIRNLENLDEALWYQSGIMADKYLSEQINNNSLTNFVISESNFDLLMTSFTFNEYKKFFNEKVAKNIGQQIVDRKNQPIVKTEQKIEPVKIEPPKEEKININPTKEEAPSIKTEASVSDNIVTPKEETKTQDVKPAETKTVAATTPVQKKEMPKFRGLYTFDEQARHYFAFYILSGNFDFASLKAALDKYNAENYPLLNMQVSLRNSGKQKVVLVSILPDLVSAKSYLSNIIRNRALFTPGLQQAQYRNLIITDENLAALDRIGTIPVYIDFMREMYLK